MKSSIIDQPITTEQADELVYKLSHILDGLYSLKKPFNTRLKSTLTLEQHSALLEYMEKKGIKTINKNKTRRLIEHIITLIRRRPVVKLQVAYQPPLSHLELIFAWIKHDIPSPLLDITIDSSIIAGAIIQYKGRYGDYSLNKRLNTNDG